MRRVSIKDLVPGMVVAEDVITFDGKLILGFGTELSDNSITKLEVYGFTSIRIDDSFADEEAKNDSESYVNHVNDTEEFRQFKRHFELTVSDIQRSFNDIILKQEINVDALLHEAEILIRKSETGLHVIDMLHSMRLYDDPTYAHCLSVSVICSLFGKYLSMPEKELNFLILASLLHDIGKVKIPNEIIGKTSPLSDEEYEKIKEHPLEGYKILQNLPLNEHVKNAALMHHERCDGSGYPSGLMYDQIDRFARIISIVDVYDAMTSPRVYRGAMSPFKVIEIFEIEGLTRYDPEYLLSFLEYIVNTYVNSKVRLSDGREGEIILINKLSLSRPMIRCGNTYVDLSREKSLSITEML